MARKAKKLNVASLADYLPEDHNPQRVKGRGAISVEPETYDCISAMAETLETSRTKVVSFLLQYYLDNNS